MPIHSPLTMARGGDCIAQSTDRIRSTALVNLGAAFSLGFPSDRNGRLNISERFFYFDLTEQRRVLILEPRKLMSNLVIRTASGAIICKR